MGQDADVVLIVSERPHAEIFIRLEIAFTPEPVLHVVVKPVEGDAVAGFEQAIGGGESVVKDGIVGEVPHGEVVNPVDGTGMGPSFRIDALNVELTGKHKNKGKAEKARG